MNELEDLWKLFSALQFYYQTLAEAISLTFPTSCAVLHIFLGNNCRALQIVLEQLKQSSNCFGWRIWDKIWGHILAFANEDLTVEWCWLTIRIVIQIIFSHSSAIHQCSYTRKKYCNALFLITSLCGLTSTKTLFYFFFLSLMYLQNTLKSWITKGCLAFCSSKKRIGLIFPVCSDIAPTNRKQKQCQLKVYYKEKYKWKTFFHCCHPYRLMVEK